MWVSCQPIFLTWNKFATLVQNVDAGESICWGKAYIYEKPSQFYCEFKISLKNGILNYLCGSVLPFIKDITGLDNLETDCRLDFKKQDVTTLYFR